MLCDWFFHSSLRLAPHSFDEVCIQSFLLLHSITWFIIHFIVMGIWLVSMFLLLQIMLVRIFLCLSFGVPMWEFSDGLSLRSRIAALWGYACLTVLGHSELFSIPTYLHCHLQHMRVLKAPQPHQHLVMFLFLTFSHEMVSYYEFNVHFPDNRWGWTSFHVFRSYFYFLQNA